MLVEFSLTCIFQHVGKIDRSGVPKTEVVGGTYDLLYQNLIRKYEDDLEY